MNKTDLEILREQASTATSAHWHAVREMNEAVNTAEWEAKRNIDRFFRSIYGARIDQLYKVKVEAETHVVEETERVALTGATSRYPLGTKMFKMVGRRSWDQKKVFGVVEVITRTSEHPAVIDGRHNFSASVGSIVVRHLKNDGTPSRRYDQYLSAWSVAETIEETAK